MCALLKRKKRAPEPPPPPPPEDDPTLGDSTQTSYITGDREEDTRRVRLVIDSLRKVTEESKGDPSNYYMDAAHAQKKAGNMAEFLRISDRAINAFCKQQKISSAARLQKEIAESLEQGLELEAAAEAYEKAAEFWHLEDTDTFKNQCLMKSADLSVLSKQENFQKAILTYERIAKEYLQVKLLQSSAKDVFLKAGLCYLANDDLVGAQQAYGDYTNNDPSFEHAREGELLSNVIKMVESKDVGGFEKTLHEYNRITPFDKTKTQILTKVKDTITAPPELDLT